ncbi:MAG: dihydropteroate synthase [Pseudomonadota bacterium]
MGILNVTPDSFSDGGDFIDPETAIARASAMEDAGASIIDIGGESTRPGSDPVDAATEQARVLPVIRRLAQTGQFIISIDTYRAETAAAAIEAGAHIVNDVWGCQRDPDIANVAAQSGAGLVIMNTRRERTVRDDLLDDAAEFLLQSLKIAHKAGVKDEAIVLDPGFGFAKTTDHDLPILNGLQRLHALGFPLLVGTSRKRFLGEITGREAADRGIATAATSVVARQKGAAIFRVHDIVENRDALAVTDALLAAQHGWTGDA